MKNEIAACANYNYIDNECPLQELCLRANLDYDTKQQADYNSHRRGNECEFFHPRVARKLDKVTE